MVTSERNDKGQVSDGDEKLNPRDDILKKKERDLVIVNRK